MKIISGGQTGADQGGLYAGKELGIPTGGFAPMGWLTENGPEPDLLHSFGLVECDRKGYPVRTWRNVEESDATVWFGTVNSPGYRCTFGAAKHYGKSFITNPDTAVLLELIGTRPVRVLNVAGNRESKNPGIQATVKLFLVNALSEVRFRS